MNNNQRFQRGGFRPNFNPNYSERGRGRGSSNRGNFSSTSNAPVTRPSAPDVNQGRGRGGNPQQQFRGSRGRAPSRGYQGNQNQRYGYEEAEHGQFGQATQSYGKSDSYRTSSASASGWEEPGQFSQSYDQSYQDGSTQDNYNYYDQTANYQQEYDYNAEADSYAGQFTEDNYYQQSDNYHGAPEQAGSYSGRSTGQFGVGKTEEKIKQAGSYSGRSTGQFGVGKTEEKTNSHSKQPAVKPPVSGPRPSGSNTTPQAKAGQTEEKKKEEEKQEEEEESSDSDEDTDFCRIDRREEKKEEERQEEEEESSDSDEDTDFCKYCNLNFTTAKAYHAHTRGIQHTSLVMEAKAKKGNVHYQKEIVDEEVLKVTIPEPKPMEVPQEEEEEEEDFENMNWMELDEQTRDYVKKKRKMRLEDRDLNPDDIGKVQFHDMYTCPLCDCKCTGAASFKMHVEGKQHKANLEQAQKGGPLKKKKTTGSGVVVEKDEEAKLMENLKKVEHPIIGLEFITEFQKPDRNAMARYVCNLCEAKCDESTVVAHLIGLKHRLKYLQAKRNVIYNHLTKYTSKKKRSEMNNNVEDFARQVEEEEGRTGVKVKIELDKVEENLEETMKRTAMALKDTVADLEKGRRDPDRDGRDKRPYDDDYDDYRRPYDYRDKRPRSDYGRPPPPPRDVYRRNPYGPVYRDRFAYDHRDPEYERMARDERRKLNDMLDRQYMLDDPLLEKKRVDDILMRRDYLDHQEQRRLDDILERRRQLQSNIKSNTDDVDYDRLKRFENRGLPSSRPRYDGQGASRPDDDQPSYQELLARRRVIDYENKPRQESSRQVIDYENKSRGEPSRAGASKQPTLSEAREQQHRAVQALKEEAAKNPSINVADVMSKLKTSMISSEDDAAMALEIANTLTQALVQYRLEKAPKQSVTESLKPKRPAPAIPGLESGAPATSKVPTFLRASTSQTSSSTGNPYKQQAQADTPYMQHLQQQARTYNQQSQVQQPLPPQSTLQLKSPVSQLTYSQAARIPSQSESRMSSSSSGNRPAQPPVGVAAPEKLLESIRKQRDLIKQKLMSAGQSNSGRR